MTGLVRKTMLLGVCGLLAAATALANVPSPANSVIPGWIPLVGSQGGVPHGQTGPGVGVAGTNMSFTVTVNDFTGNPIQGSLVLLDFGACVANGTDGAGENDLRVCDAIIGAGSLVGGTWHASDQVCGAAGTAGDMVSATTDANGQVTLTVLGGTFSHDVDGPGTKEQCVEISADGVSLGFATAFAVDVNGDGTNSGLDYSFAVVDVDRYTLSGGTIFRSRAAFNGRGRGPGVYVLDGLDKSVIQALDNESALGRGSASGCMYYDGGGVQQAGSYCP